jgi:hypothetical protein
MKRQVIAIALGSFIALPALANDEINAGNLPQSVAATKAVAQVRAELLAAQRAGDVVVNAELGTTAKHAEQLSTKSRADVRAEVRDARLSGDYIVNAELGTTANQL